MKPIQYLPGSKFYCEEHKKLEPTPGLIANGKAYCKEAYIKKYPKHKEQTNA